MEQCSLTPLADLTIANTVSDLIQGDIREHLPLERIPLQGDVLGLGTTSSLENGELSFLRNASGNSDIWRSTRCRRLSRSAVISPSKVSPMGMGKSTSVSAMPVHLM